jgi:hypothetical protein
MRSTCPSCFSDHRPHWRFFASALVRLIIVLVADEAAQVREDRFSLTQIFSACS